jgi:FkbM family methyltransferase
MLPHPNSKKEHRQQRRLVMPFAILSAYGALPHHPGKGMLIEHFLPPLGAAHERRKRTRFGIRFECDLDDKLSRAIYFSGFEVPDIRALRRIVKRGDVVLDVGANIGYYSLLFAKWRAVVHAFEPFPDTARKLHRNLDLNPTMTVSVWETALSDHVGEISMSVPDMTNCGCNYVTSAAGAIQATTLDAFVDAHDLRQIDFIKADVEGSEIAFLHGAVETIKRFRPKLMIEINPATLRRFERTAADLVELLGRCRYRLATATTFGRFRPLDRLPVYGQEPNVYAFPID